MRLPSRFRSLCLLVALVTSSQFLLAASCNPQKWRHGDVLGSGALRGERLPILRPKWRRGIDPDHRFNPLTWKLAGEETSSPVIDEVHNLVCVGSERQRVSCINQKTGASSWTFKTQGRVLAKPIVQERVLYVGTTSGVFYALQTLPGKKNDRLKVKVKWKYSADGEILSQAAFLPSSGPKKPALIIFTTSNNKITALRADTGKWEWQQKHDPPDRLSIRGQAPPVVEEDKVFTGYSNGLVVAYKASSGKILWKRSIKEKDRFADIDSAPSVSEGKLYVASYSGSVHCLKTSDGTPVWKYKMRGVSRVEVRDSDIFLSNNNGYIASLTAETGKQRWKRRYRKAGAFGDPLTDDQNLYVSSTDKGIFVLRPDDGKFLQRIDYRVGFARPIVHSRNMYVLAYNSLLYSFQIAVRTDAL